MDKDRDQLVPIPGELASVAFDGVVSAASRIYDYEYEKFQSEINKEKADKILDGSVGNFVTFDSSGNLVDSGKNEHSFDPDYETMKNIPTINDVSIYGNMTGDELGLVDAVEGYGLSQNNYSDSEKNWVGSNIYEDLFSEALSLFNVNVSVDPESRTLVKDQRSSYTFVVTDTLTFDGTPVNPDTVPNGWFKIGDGVYRTTMETSSSAVIPSTTWTYSTDYKDEHMVLEKQVKGETLVPLYPSYYGLSNSRVPSYASNAVAGLERVVTNTDVDVTFNNNSGNDQWLWVLTKGNADVEQLGSSIVGDPYTNVSFISHENINITMTGYKLYVSKYSVENGSSFDNVKIKINI